MDDFDTIWTKEANPVSHSESLYLEPLKEEWIYKFDGDSLIGGTDGL